MAYLGVTLNLAMSGTAGVATPDAAFTSDIVRFYTSMTIAVALLCLIGF